MKKLLLFAIALLLSLMAKAQQITIDPANLGEHITLSSLVKLSDGSYVNVGTITNPQALVMQIEGFGTSSAWAKVCGQYSETLDVKQSPNGNVVVCGWADDNALLASFDSQNGSTIWSKTFATDSVERLNGIDIDPSGNIYAVGSKRFSLGDAREIYMKLDASGNVLWSKQVDRGPATESSAKYCYYKGDSLIVVGSSFAAGGGFSNGSVTVTVLSSSTGSIINHRMYGTHNTEIVLDAKASPAGLFILCSSGNSFSRILMKLEWWSLGLSYDPTMIYGAGYSFDSGTLMVNGWDIYVSGGVTEVGNQASYVIKFNQNLIRQWSKKMITNSHGTAGAGIVGGVIIANKKNTGESVLGVVGYDGETICNPVTNLTDLETIPNPFSSGPPSIGFSLMNTNFALGETMFVDYEPEVTPCNVLLPVEFVSFVGESEGETSVLSWQTASERQTSHFKVLRLEDGGDWKEIGTVDAAGESQYLLDYRFVDENPLTGDNYYRLETVDLDGSTEYSDVVHVYFSGSENFVVFPNPAKAGGWVTIKGKFQTVEAYDRMGRQVPFQRNGNQLALQVDPGVYILNITDANNALKTVRIVVE